MYFRSGTSKAVLSQPTYISLTTTMSEVVNVLVAFAVIIFIFRWMTSGESMRELSSFTLNPCLQAEARQIKLQQMYSVSDPKTQHSKWWAQFLNLEFPTSLIQIFPGRYNTRHVPGHSSVSS